MASHRPPAPDLLEIGRYIAEDNPARALSFVIELQARAAQAAERPNSFPERDDIADGLRAITHGRYLLFFRDLADEVRIVRVLHGARDLASAFDPGPDPEPQSDA